MIKDESHNGEAARFGAEPLAREIVDVIDNLERSMKDVSPETNPGLADGLAITLAQFKAVLGKHGIKLIILLR